MQTGRSHDAALAQAEREYTDALERASTARQRAMAGHGYTPLAAEEEIELEAFDSPGQSRPPAAALMDRPPDAAAASSDLGRAEASAAALRSSHEQDDGLALLALLEANLDTDHDELVEMLVDLQAEMRPPSASMRLPSLTTLPAPVTLLPAPSTGSSLDVSSWAAGGVSSASTSAAGASAVTGIPTGMAVTGPATNSFQSNASGSAGGSMDCGACAGASAGAGPSSSARVGGGEAGEGWQLLADVVTLLQQGASVHDLLPQLRRPRERGASSTHGQPIAHRALSVRGDDTDGALHTDEAISIDGALSIDETLSDETPDDSAGGEGGLDSWVRPFGLRWRTGAAGYGRVPEGGGEGSEGVDMELGDVTASPSSAGGSGVRAPWLANLGRSNTDGGYALANLGRSNNGGGYALNNLGRSNTGGGYALTNLRRSNTGGGYSLVNTGRSDDTGGGQAFAGLAGSDAELGFRSSSRTAQPRTGLPYGLLCACAAGCLVFIAVPVLLASCVVMLPPLTHGLVYSHLWREYDRTVLSRAGLYWVGPFKRLRLAPATLQTLSLPHLSALSSDGLRLSVDLSVQWRYDPLALRKLFLTLPPQPPLPPAPIPEGGQATLASADGALGPRPEGSAAGGPAAAALRLLNLIISAQNSRVVSAQNSRGGGSATGGAPAVGADGPETDTVNDETVTDGAGDGSAVEFPGARVLRAVVSSVAQSVLTHYAMHHLFEVKRDITEQVRIAVAAAASPYGIVVESAQLVRVEVPPLVEAALEASAISKLEIKRGETHKEMMRSAFAIQALAAEYERQQTVAVALGAAAARGEQAYANAASTRLLVGADIDAGVSPEALLGYKWYDAFVGAGGGMLVLRGNATSFAFQ